MNTTGLNHKHQIAEFSLPNELNAEEIKNQFTVNFFNLVQQIDFHWPLEAEAVAQISSKVWEYFILQRFKRLNIQGGNDLNIKNIDFIAFEDNHCIFQTFTLLGYGASKKIFDGAVISLSKGSLGQTTIKIQVVAIKRIEKYVYEAKKEDNMARKLSEFNSSHIMKPALFTLNVCPTKKFPKRTMALVCEKLAFDLEQVLESKNNKIPPLKFIDKVRLVKGALKGVVVFHNANIIHRDLKSSNIMAFKEVGGKNGYKAVLIDFEDSTRVEDVYDGENGTQMYKPPEAIGGSATLQWDLWAFGMTLWEALKPNHMEFPIYENCTREEINDKLNELSKFDRTKMQEEIFKEWQPSSQEEKKIQEIILNLLSINPQDRGTAQGVYAELNAVYKSLKKAALNS